MKPYVDLPNYFRDFLKPFNHRLLGPNADVHTWNTIPTDTVLTKEGIKWYLSKGLIIRPHSLLFRIPKNFTGPIHIDNFGSNVNEVGFNFVLEGSGKMQWMKNINEEPRRTWSQKDQKYFLSYENISLSSFEITHTWEGNAGIVKISIPHRIVTFNEERYCLSLRTVNPIKFNNIISKTDMKLAPPEGFEPS